MSEQSLDSLIGTRARDENGRFVSVTPTEEKVEPKVEAKPELQVEAQPTPAAKAPEPVVTPPAAPASPVVATPPVENPETAAYKKAMREEREKRQALERQLRELQTPKAPVDPWTDLPGALQSQQQQLDERLFVERCNLTEQLVREKHADFDDVREVFLEAAQGNPALWQQMRQELNPAQFVYREGLRIRELKDVGGDFSAYRTKLRAEIEKDVRAELEAKYGQPAVVPTSLNSDNSPVVTEPVYAGPPPLKSILRNASRS